MTQAEIEARIEALEQLASQQTADVLTPNVITVNPTTGAIEEQLSGFLQAQGILLPEEAVSATVNSIEWQYQGERGSRIVGEHTNPKHIPETHQLLIQTVGQVSSPNIVLKGAGNGTIELNLPEGVGGAEGSNVQVNIAGHKAVLLRGDGASSFLQAAGPVQVAIASWGRVHGAEGGVLYGSEDFTVALVEAGVYRITWNTEKSSGNLYAPIVTAANTAATWRVSEINAKGFRVNTFNKEEKLTSSDFSFIVIASSE